jgi:hypothetical protein
MDERPLALKIAIFQPRRFHHNQGFPAVDITSPECLQRAVALECTVAAIQAISNNIEAAYNRMDYATAPWLVMIVWLCTLFGLRVT